MQTGVNPRGVKLTQVVMKLEHQCKIIRDGVSHHPLIIFAPKYCGLTPV